MAMRFAGARWLDERRRRRLAVDQETPGTSESATSAEGGETSQVKPSRPANLSLRTVVPQSAWVVLAWSLLLLGACDAVIAAAWYQDRVPEMVRVAHKSVFGVDSPYAATWTTSALLVVSAQLALVIGWVRSHCLTDFDGRYRSWTRVAISWLVIAGIVGTGAHQAISQVLVAQFGFEGVWQREVLAWLLPLAALGASVVLVMDGEMKTSRSARLLLWFSTAIAVAGLVLVLEPTLIDEAVIERFPHMLAFLKLAAMVSAPALMVVSMGVFLRHVVHVSPEPAPRRKWRSKKRFSEEEDQLVDEETAEDATVDEETADEDEETADVDEETADVDEETVDEETAEDELVEEEEYAEEYAEEEQQEDDRYDEIEEREVEEHDYAYSEYDDTTGSRFEDDESHYRIDEPESSSSNAFPDPDALKGLSKRERRRMRKRWRQQQRQMDQ
jgi:hypothetical protein